MSRERPIIEPIGRRSLLGAMAGAGVGMTVQPGAAAAGPRRTDDDQRARSMNFGPDASGDVTRRLQAAIDEAASRRIPLVLAPGRYPVRALTLRAGLDLSGHGSATRIDVTEASSAISGEQVDGLRLARLALTGNPSKRTLRAQQGLVSLRNSTNIALEDLDVMASPASAIALERCGGRLTRLRIRAATHAAIFSIDATGLAITDNDIADCADNGILVWASRPAEDGTLVAHNRIARIGAASGGSGQYGNGVNVFRAGSVTVTSNRITDCAFTAVRGNAASNIQILANSCARLGEVALYAEFGFEGALIANNLVDRAAAGISVTNYNEGGRLAVIQGNLVRNLFRREHEPVDKRGEGIGVEADAAVTGNTIENAPTAGIAVGWGKYMRNVAVTGNVIRNVGIGIAVTGDIAAGTALVATNLIAEASLGAVRTMRLATPYGADLTTTPALSGRIVVHGNAVA